MKKFIAIAACITLAACGGAEAPETEEAAVEAPAMVEGAGTFDYASADGAATGQIVMNEDGTYVDTEDGKDPLTGTWRASEGQTCFTGSEEGASEVCWTDSEPAEDGSFTSTSPDGAVVNVRPAAE